MGAAPPTNLPGGAPPPQTPRRNKKLAGGAKSIRNSPKILAGGEILVEILGARAPSAAGLLLVKPDSIFLSLSLFLIVQC